MSLDYDKLSHYSKEHIDEIARIKVATPEYYKDEFQLKQRAITSRMRSKLLDMRLNVGYNMASVLGILGTVGVLTLAAVAYTEILLNTAQAFSKESSKVVWKKSEKGDPLPMTEISEEKDQIEKELERLDRILRKSYTRVLGGLERAEVLRGNFIVKSYREYYMKDQVTPLLNVKMQSWEDAVAQLYHLRGYFDQDTQRIVKHALESEVMNQESSTQLVITLEKFLLTAHPGTLVSPKSGTVVLDPYPEGYREVGPLHGIADQYAQWLKETIAENNLGKRNKSQ